MGPKYHTGLFVVIVVLLGSLFAGIQPAMANNSAPTRNLSAVQAQQKIHLLHLQRKSETVINFWNHRGHWALHLPGTKYGRKSCSQVVGKERRQVCKTARRSLAAHTQRLASVERKLQDLMPWSADVRQTAHYRHCLMGHESIMEPDPYKAENGGTRYIEGGGKSNASGGYQFLDDTWKTMLRLAEAYYGEEISNTTHAADAPAWAQDTVAAFDIKVYHASDWTWSDCG